MTAPAGKKKPGPKPLSDGEVMKSRTLRMTDRQHNKMLRLGGASWVRQQIDAAKARK